MKYRLKKCKRNGTVEEKHKYWKKKSYGLGAIEVKHICWILRKSSSYEHRKIYK